MSNMANIIGSHFVSSSIYFIHVSHFVQKSNLIDIHCKPFTIPIKGTTRVLIAKGGQLTGKMGTILLIFFNFSGKTCLVLLTCMSAHQ